jgi:hypothetical protein
MPETAMDHHNGPKPWKNQVRLARQSPVMQPEPQSKPMQPEA